MMCVETKADRSSACVSHRAGPPVAIPAIPATSSPPWHTISLSPRLHGQPRRRLARYLLLAGHAIRSSSIRREREERRDWGPAWRKPVSSACHGPAGSFQDGRVALRLYAAVSRKRRAGPSGCVIGRRGGEERRGEGCGMGVCSRSLQEPSIKRGQGVG